MKYPETLITLVKNRTKGMRLEGINEGAGPLQPKLIIVGEAPGREEINSHIPFHGDSGKELMKSLASIGLKREDVYITSAVRSRPYSVKKVFSKRENKEVIKYPNRKPTRKEVLAHAPFLDYELKHVDCNLIVAVGNTALDRLLGKNHKISLEHGHIIEDTSILELNRQLDGYQWSKKKYHIFPTYHPAAVFYKRKLAADIARDWQVLGKYIKDKNYEQ